MEKVKVTREQAEAIETAITEFGKDRVIDGVLGKWVGELSPLNDLKPSEFARIMYDAGYEVEPEFKVGDWVVTKATNHVGKIRGFSNIANYYDVEGILTDHIRHATPSEIAEEKERRFWKKHGREVWELRKGDVLQNKHTGLPNIAVVESFIDGKPSFGLKEINYKKNYYVVCFAENRLDVDVNES